MKKTILTVATALCFSGAFAQDLTSKKGEPILPEADDWSISIEAAPFLDYFGNMLNGSTSNASPAWFYLNNHQTIIGKMFVDEKTAYRAILRLGFNSQKNVAKIIQPVATAPVYPALPTYVEDTRKISSKFIGIGGGIEMRRGKTRLQGFYGGDVMIYFSGAKATYEYGNALAPTATPPVTVANSTNFSAVPVLLPIFNNTMPASNITTDTYGGAARMTEYKMGSTMGIAVRGFIGAEYFILPKISIGGEFGWGIGFGSTGKTTINTESIGGTNQVGTQTIETTKGSRFGLDTDVNATGTLSSALRLNLHF